MNYKDLAEQTEKYIIEQRRWFHQHPELSWEEFKTTEHIVEELKKLGYEPQTFDGRPGCYAMLKGGKATANSKTVALRADIDALPVTEKTGVEYASLNEGVMHACGHDNHAAMLLGAAKILMDTKDELAGNVKLFFQAAEETCFGAEYYVEQGILDDVDAIYGQHVWGTLESGYINVQSGPRMASADNFIISIEGVSAHGTQPHLGVDAIVAAASVIMNLQTFASRVNDPLNPMILSIGEIQGGQRMNIIANHVEMKGTVRTFDGEFRKTVKDKMENIIKKTAESFGAVGTLEYEAYPSPLINDDEDLNKIAHDAAVKLYGEESLKELPMMMGSEDFSYYADKIPAIYGYLGTRSEKLGFTATNHNDHYNLDESILKRGTAMLAQFAFDYLQQ